MNRDCPILCHQKPSPTILIYIPATSASPDRSATSRISTISPLDAMADRRYYSNDVYQQGPWNGASGYATSTYPANSIQYASPSYSSQGGGIPPQSPSSYGSISTQHSGMAAAYYPPDHNVYAPVPQRPNMTSPHNPYPSTKLAINVPSQSPVQSRAAPQVSAPYSSRPAGYAPTSPQSPTMAYTPPQYGHPGSPSSQYPASPQRPYACDMCALSFNRQHDLKRHRDTHTGEKPFLCNGGCGKTFTRKVSLRSRVGSQPLTSPIEGCVKASPGETECIGL
jgi:hypothetical protein